MQWNSSENAGFTTGKPWLPVPPTYKTHNVADESKDPDSVLEFYKQVLSCAIQIQLCSTEVYTAINENDANVLSYLRIYKDQTVVVALNMSGSPQKLKLDLKSNGFLIGHQASGHRQIDSQRG